MIETYYTSVQIEVATSTGAATSVCTLVPERSVMSDGESFQVFYTDEKHIYFKHIPNWVCAR